MFRMRGFTLVELLVTLTVLAVVAGLAVPAMERLVAANRVQAVSTGLMNALLQAKAEAATRNTFVSVCASADGTQCLNSGDFAQGWIVYEDTGAGDATVVAELIHREGPHQGVRTPLVALPPNASTRRHFFRYTPAGMSQYGATPVSAHRISICDTGNLVEPRVLEIAATTGQVRTGRAQDADCS